MKSKKQSQQGTGSGENKGDDRNSQKNNMTHLNEKDKQNIAAQINEDQSRVADLNEWGVLSGRDDYAGAPGDDMSDESTNEATDR